MYGGMICAGTDYMMQNTHIGMPLSDRVRVYAAAPADCHPGEGTGYSVFSFSYIISRQKGGGKDELDGAD